MLTAPWSSRTCGRRGARGQLSIRCRPPIRWPRSMRRPVRRSGSDDRQHRRAREQRPTGFAPTCRPRHPSSTRRKALIYMISADGRLMASTSRRRSQADPAAGIRHAVFTQLEPQSHRRRALHDRRTRMRQRSGAGRASASARNDSRRGAPHRRRWRRAARRRAAREGAPAGTPGRGRGRGRRRRPLRRT